ncbi:hypothetical protein QMT40_003081 [Parvibaculaceae bacterium PLY_AMNH_Bact1]|nr:hypothetical protein QMT40_003081 [Parvibaculaceae bacterium PLY_AMNH_Bact1]
MTAPNQCPQMRNENFKEDMLKMQFALRFITPAIALCVATSALAFDADWIRDWPQQAQDAVPRQSTMIADKRGQITNYSTSDEGVSLILADLRRIRSAETNDQKEAAQWIVEHQLDLPPPYLYEAARQLLGSDKNQAAETYLLAFVRTRYDASKCLDRSAPQGIAFFSMEMPEVPKALQGDAGTVAAALEKVRQRLDLFSHQASSWWICSHGIRNSVVASSNQQINLEQWRKPESDWAGLRQAQLDSLDRSLARLATQD